MRNFLFISLALLLLSSCKQEPPKPELIAAQTAKAYYEQLLQGHYADFVAGTYQPDSIPAAYRKALEDNARRFVHLQDSLHKGISKVDVAGATLQPKDSTVNAYLLFVFGDSTREQVLVPMVRRHQLWLMR